MLCNADIFSLIWSGNWGKRSNRFEFSGSNPGKVGYPQLSVKALLLPEIAGILHPAFWRVLKWHKSTCQVKITELRSAPPGCAPWGLSSVCAHPESSR